MISLEFAVGEEIWILREPVIVTDERGRLHFCRIVDWDMEAKTVLIFVVAS